MKSNLDWDRFKIFYHIAQAGSFTQAAKILNTAQPSLTRSIQNLEAQLKITLFIRTPKGVKLTSEGHILFRSVEKIYREFIQSELYLQEHQKNTQSILKIGILKTLSYDAILNKILGFATRYPDVKLKIIQVETEAEILTYKIDVALLSGPLFTQEDLIQDYLCSFHQRLYASSSYIKKFGFPETKEDLNNHQLILFNDQENQLSWPFERTQNEECKDTHFCIDSCEGMRRAAEAGHGIAALIIDPQDLKGSSLVEILPNSGTREIPLHLTYPSYLELSQRINQFKDYLKEVLRGKEQHIHNCDVTQKPVPIYAIKKNLCLGSLQRSV